MMFSIMGFGLRRLVRMRLAFLLLVTLTISGQSQDRVVELRSYRSPVPMEIVDVKIKDKSVASGKSFNAEDNWLNGLTLRLRNASAKPVVSLRVVLAFPEARYKDGTLGHQMIYGDSSVKRVNNIGKILVPGESVDLVLTKKQYAHLRRYVEKNSKMKKLNKVSIGVAIVIFEDGTVWTSDPRLRP